MTKVLIAEDERPIARLLEMNLTRAGYVCTLAPDGLTAADLIEKNDYDLALLDIMLPGLDGYALLDYLRPQGVPVIFLTAKAAVKDRVLGLRLGADDYIVVPFSLTSLLRKIQDVYKMGVLRPRKIYRFKDIILDDTAKTVSLNDHSVTLTKNEFKLLKMLMSHPYQPYTSTKIFEGIWGDSVYADDQSVMNLVSSLIIKLNRTGSHEEYIRRFGANSYKMAI